MLLKALPKVSGEANITLATIGNTFNEINIEHERPSFAEASEGILLRSEVGANPAKLVERSRMAETEGFEPSIPLWGMLI
jgi:hypothetical protein